MKYLLFILYAICIHSQNPLGLIAKIKALAAEKGITVTIESLEENSYPMNQLAQYVSPSFCIEKPSKCEKVSLISKDENPIVCWIHSFKNEESSNQFIRDLEKICVKKGFEKSVLRKAFMECKKYKNQVYIVRRIPLKNSNMDIYESIIDLGTGALSCWNK